MVDYEWRINILEKIYGSQTKLSESIGVAERTIRYWKSGGSNPSQSNKEKLNSRWSYFKKRMGLYRYEKLKAIDPDTGEEFIINNRTDVGELDKNIVEDIESEQEDTLQRIKESAEEQGYTEFEVIESEFRFTPFSGHQNMDVLKNNMNVFPTKLR